MGRGGINEQRWRGIRSLAAVWCAVVTGCSPSPDPPTSREAQSAIEVVAASGVMEAVASMIGGDGVVVIGSPGIERPSSEAIASMIDADVVLMGGAGDPAWMRSASWPRDRVVVTGASYAHRWIPLDEVEHQHGPEGHVERGAMVAETWMDPSLAIEQTLAIVDALADAVPEDKSAIEARGRAWTDRLAGFDRQLRSIVMLDPKRPVIVVGPRYRYLTRRYGVRAVEVNGGPSEIDLAGLSAAIETSGATIIMMEDEPDDQTAVAMESRGLTSVVIPTVIEGDGAGRLVQAYERVIDQFAVIYGSTIDQ